MSTQFVQLGYVSLKQAKAMRAALESAWGRAELLETSTTEPVEVPS